VAEQKQPQQERFEREARRLEKLRSLRLVEQPPKRIVTATDDDYEPEHAA
jgi:hypothetical protein